MKSVARIKRGTHFREICRLLYSHSLGAQKVSMYSCSCFVGFADCIMDKKHYEDGTKTKVDCNGW